MTTGEAAGGAVPGEAGAARGAAVGAAGLVASGHPSTTDAAAAILRAGGNAFDAVVAAGFASAACEPALTSLGGGGFLLARTADGKATLFDFFVDTPGRGVPDANLQPHFFPVTVRFPGSEQDFNVGLGSVAVPGTLKGYLHVQRRLGRLPLGEVLQPAISLARDGVAMNPRQAYFFELLEPILTLTERGRALYAPGGRPITRGKLLRNADLASFLETLPRDGARNFYEGALAAQVAAEMSEGRGLLTVDDLSAYQVHERPPLASPYRGHQLLTNGAPSFGGPLIAVSLALLETCPVSRHRFGSPEHLCVLAGVLQQVERLRETGCQSPANLTDEVLDASTRRIRSFSRGTTHVSVTDVEGNVASMTHSNGEGSGYIVPGTGIMLNNMMGEDDLHPAGFHASPPGHRVASMMSPSVLLRDGEVVLVVGSGGSKRIRTALVQVISNVVDFGMKVHDAVEKPRLHWDGDHVQLEPGFPEEGVEALRSRLPVNVWSERNVYFGGVHAVQPGRDGAGDPRRGGSATRVG